MSSNSVETNELQFASFRELINRLEMLPVVAEMRKHNVTKAVRIPSLNEKSPPCWLQRDGLLRSKITISGSYLILIAYNRDRSETYMFPLATVGVL